MGHCPEGPREASAGSAPSSLPGRGAKLHSTCFSVADRPGLKDTGLISLLPLGKTSLLEDASV